LSAPEARAALGSNPSIPRDAEGPVFPTPWAARAFALAVALNQRGVFGWPEWSRTLGERVAESARDDPADPETYWRAWLAALEDILVEKKVGSPGALVGLRQAWRAAAERTPHGQPIELPARPGE